MTPAAVAAADVVVILTKHKSVDYATIAEHADLVVDTANAIPAATQGDRHARIVRL